METVYLALGSNVGDSLHYLQKAYQLLGDGVLQNPRMAPIYRSKPVGYIDQPDFLNTVVSGQTDLAPGELLTRIKQLEHQIGRIKRFRWGPREVDIDIILYGDLVFETPDLIIPHPSYHERIFVLQPLLDLDPSLVDPASHKPIAKILADLPADTAPLEALTSEA
jgi:2-amino-4-hydroxy-6-hydroxymethyldihydropteridine diphosphokinase